MRCLALAGAWQRQGGTAACITRCDSEPLRQRCRFERVEVIPVPEDDADPEALDLTLSVLQSQDDAWLVIDHYGIGAGFQTAIRRAGHPLLVIDDNAHLALYDADLLLNQNVHADELSYCLSEGALPLFGARYALLRPEFLVRGNRGRETAPVARRILVTLGGADPNNTTLTVVQALKRLEIPGLQARIVVGPSNPHRPSLEEALAGTRGNLKLLSTVSDMSALMAWAEVAVSAAGSTCWELAYLGLPSLLVVLADNQARIAQSLHTQGAARSLGWYEQVEIDLVVDALKELMNAPSDRRQMTQILQELVDGQGSDRVVAQMMQHTREQATASASLRASAVHSLLSPFLTPMQGEVGVVRDRRNIGTPLVKTEGRTG